MASTKKESERTANGLALCQYDLPAFVVNCGDLGFPSAKLTELVPSDVRQLEEAEDFANSQESKLGPLRVFDRHTDEVVYVSVTGRRDPKPPWP